MRIIFEILRIIFEGILWIAGEKAIDNIECLRSSLKRIIRANNPEIITEILNKSFIPIANEYGYTIKNAQKFPAFIQCTFVADEIRYGLRIFAYREGKKLVGCVGYVKSSNGVYEIKNFAVLPEFQRKGIGKKLLIHTEKEIKKFSAKIAEVCFDTRNTKLKQWFEKMGYKETEIKEVKGLSNKICIMQKSIK